MRFSHAVHLARLLRYLENLPAENVRLLEIKDPGGVIIVTLEIVLPQVDYPLYYVKEPET